MARANRRARSAISRTKSRNTIKVNMDIFPGERFIVGTDKSGGVSLVQLGHGAVGGQLGGNANPALGGRQGTATRELVEA